MTGGGIDASEEARIAELRDKLRDEAYMAGAILRIATIMSARLAEGYEGAGRKKR